MPRRIRSDMNSYNRLGGWIGGATLVLALGACGQPPAPFVPVAAPAATKTAADRYPLTGEITGVDATRKVLIVKHDEIKGYMPAMTMEFLVSAADLAAAKPGQRIRAEMIPSPDGDFRLEKIWPDDRLATTAVAAAARGLRENTMTRGKNVYREVGEAMPDFTLYNQAGQAIPSGHFRGKKVMMNFIFTRCPVATMCPASTAKMMATQKLAREAAVAGIEFVSITLDPAFDTPAVLQEYATVRGIDTANFSFLTGPESAIRDLLTQFGIIAEFEGDLLKHTLATVLVDERGKIIHRADGSVWEAREFVAKMKASQ
jgi:protein SCO1/2